MIINIMLLISYFFQLQVEHNASFFLSICLGLRNPNLTAKVHKIYGTTRQKSYKNRETLLKIDSNLSILLRKQIFSNKNDLLRFCLASLYNYHHIYPKSIIRNSIAVVLSASYR